MAAEEARYEWYIGRKLGGVFHTLTSASFSEKIGKPTQLEGSTLGGQEGWDGLDSFRIWETPLQSSGQEVDQHGEEGHAGAICFVRGFPAGRKLSERGRFSCAFLSSATASLTTAAGEVQHLGPRQGVICQRRLVHCSWPPLWASGTQWVRRRAGAIKGKGLEKKKGFSGMAWS